MLLVDRVVAWDGQHAVVAATPRADAWYSEQGAMPAWIGVELMAQAIAAHVGLVARSHGRPPNAGVLLGTRQYRATQSHFDAGTELLITARLNYRDDSGLGAYDSAITLQGAEVATASVNVYEPPDFAAFLKEQLAP